MQDAEQVWRSKTDDEVVEAGHVLADYTEEGERIIRAELRRRGLAEPLAPIGRCSRCDRSIHEDDAGLKCVQCGEPFPAAIQSIVFGNIARGTHDQALAAAFGSPSEYPDALQQAVSAEMERRGLTSDEVLRVRGADLISYRFSEHVSGVWFRMAAKWGLLVLAWAIYQSGGIDQPAFWVGVAVLVVLSLAYAIIGAGATWQLARTEKRLFKCPKCGTSMELHLAIMKSQRAKSPDRGHDFTCAKCATRFVLDSIPL